MKELENQLKELLISALQLRDVKVADINRDTPLFDGGLGLDSIDILELGVALDEHFGIRIRSDDPEHRRAFETLGTLADFVASERSA